MGITCSRRGEVTDSHGQGLDLAGDRVAKGVRPQCNCCIPSVRLSTALSAWVFCFLLAEGKQAVAVRIEPSGRIARSGVCCLQ